MSRMRHVHLKCKQLRPDESWQFGKNFGTFQNFRHNNFDNNTTTIRFTWPASPCIGTHPHALYHEFFRCWHAKFVVPVWGLLSSTTGNQTENLNEKRPKNKPIHLRWTILSPTVSRCDHPFTSYGVLRAWDQRGLHGDLTFNLLILKLSCGTPHILYVQSLN